MSRLVGRALGALLLFLAFVAPSHAADSSPITEWIRATAQPFDTCEAIPRDDDLASLRSIVGDARIVSLGEGTHGTREFFQLKHRITKYLAEHMGFRVFAIEANLPEAWRMNDYVLGGEGDPRKLLDGMYFWTWNTEEVLELVEWMRIFNASKAGRIEFTGFDMQFPDTAASIVRTFLAKHDRAWVESLEVVVPAERDPGFVTSTGSLPVKEFAGHRVRYSGWIRTEGVTGYAGLWLRADTPERPSKAFDNMQGQSVRGTRDWRRYEFALDVPEDTHNIRWGVLVSGGGTAWFDSLSIEVDGQPWTSPEIDLAVERSDGPIGTGRGTYSSRYGIAMDDAVAHTGQRSLRLSVGAPAEPARRTLATADRLLARVESRRAAYASATSPARADWIIRNAHVLTQYTRLKGGPGGSYGVRDSSMAANVAWIADEARKGEKVVLWAHNGHVARRLGWMGDHLAKRYGKQMVVVGFATNSGEYTAFKDGKLVANNPLVEGPPASIESFAHAAGTPRFLLDLRRARENAAAESALRSGVMMRSIGALAMDMQFGITPILNDYDVLAWVDHTTATRCFRLTPVAAK